jgi:archaemetzincin
MNSNKRIIGVVPVGEVPELAPKVIVAHITGYLKLSAEVLNAVAHPAYAFDETRLQYNAGSILNCFDSSSFDEYDKVIGVLNVDLFVPIFTHVFGEAKQNGKYALVSLFRLAEGKEGIQSPSALIFERAAKVALHELGHLFDLFHCQDNNCLMHFSGDLEDLDHTPFYFCRYCAAYYRDALSRN